MNQAIPLITVLGPTAVGKTAFAAHLALVLNAEIISADSRQVFRGMDIGTGKDLDDYKIGDREIVPHLIDIVDPGTEYNVYQFRHDFEIARSSILAKGKIPILCGGTGLYLEAVLSNYNMNDAPVNKNLRCELAELNDIELVSKLSALRTLHNTTDIQNRDRLIRAIEIEWHKQNHKEENTENQFVNTPIFGIRFDRKTIRERITARLKQRLNEGMTEEVQQLLNNGISKERLMMYGLEYKYVTMYLDGKMTHSEMFTLLNTAIHQFAKRQMTWFRRMEKNGIKIFWLEGEDGLLVNLNKAMNYITSK